MMSNWAQQQMLNDNLQRNLHNATSLPRRGLGPSVDGHAAPSRSASGPRPGRATGSTTYRASPEVTARVGRQFATYAEKIGGAAGGAEVRRDLASKPFVSDWSRAVAEDGLHPGDVADAMASYLVLNWLMATGRTDNTPAQSRAVRAQVKAAISHDAGFTALSEAQRQEMAEVFMLNFLYQAHAYIGATRRGDRAPAAHLGDAAEARFRNEMRIDLHSLSLTDQGLVRRG